MEQARHELDAMNDRIQASEKTWGSVSHILKAIAIQRGWDHYGHNHINAIGDQIIREFDKVHLRLPFEAANAQHQNFYENHMPSDRIRFVIDALETFVIEMDEVLRAPPRRYTVQHEDDQARLHLLLGYPDEYVIPMGSYSNVGFSRNHPDTDPGAFQVNNPPPPGLPPADARSQPPRSRAGRPLGPGQPGMPDGSPRGPGPRNLTLRAPRDAEVHRLVGALNQLRMLPEGERNIEPAPSFRLKMPATPETSPGGGAGSLPKQHYQMNEDGASPSGNASRNRPDQGKRGYQLGNAPNYLSL